MVAYHFRKSMNLDSSKVALFSYNLCFVLTQRFPRRKFGIFVVYVATSLVNKDTYMLILQYKVSFTYDRLGRCFRFVYIYACIAVFCVAAVSR